MKKKHEATLANAPLNTEEKRDFKRLDGVVKKACDAQWEMAAALNEIRERKLYRADHPTFEAYCKKQHAFTRTRAYQLTAAAEVRKQIENVYHGRQIYSTLPSGLLQSLGLSVELENDIQNDTRKDTKNDITNEPKTSPHKWTAHDKNNTRRGRSDVFQISGAFVGDI